MTIPNFGKAERRKAPRNAAQREAQLITLDYGGKERKIRVLRELLVERDALQSKVDSITYDNVINLLPARGVRPEAAEYVSDVLLVIRKMLR